MGNEIAAIDIVIPWVDDQDAKWQAERDKYLGEFHEKKSNLAHYFRDWDTLKYVFRSIEVNMPWVRYIHFITCGHLPKWLNEKASKLKIHRHSDFFTEGSALPTFSARPIEMNLMNIPGLAEKFVYFNDDTVVSKPLTSDRFFFESLPIDYLSLDIPRGGRLYNYIRVKDPYARTVRNSIDLLNKIYPLKDLVKRSRNIFFDKSYPKIFKIRNLILCTLGVFDWITVNHNPQPFLLSNLHECERLFPEQVKETRKHRFREYTDLNQYLYRDYALMSGQFQPHYFGDGYCFVLSSVDRYTKERHFINEKAFLCFNDTQFLSEDEYPKLREMVIADLLQLFPNKSSFEK